MAISLATLQKKIKPRYYLMVALCVMVMTIILWPLLVSFLASVEVPTAATDNIPAATTFSFKHYEKVISYQNGLWNYLQNSLWVAALTILFCLLLAVPAGYGLARFNMRGKELIFLALLISMMIPYQALLVPLFMMFSALGLSASLFGLAILHTILQLPFSVFIMRNSFEGLPKELDEAASIDGASAFFAFRRVFLPLALPGIVTVSLFAFIASWNEFLGALILMNKETAFTVPIMLTGVVSGNYGAVDWGALQASVIISIIPCLIVYLALQKYYMSGLLSGAVK